MPNPAACYTEFLRAVEALGPASLHAAEAGTLRDAADARLFDEDARSADEAAHALLDRLVEHGRLSPAAARRLDDALCAITPVRSATAA
jgi:hypothetical protein